MAQPYSYHLRQKVIQAIQLDSLKIMEASILFNISRNTIGLWLKRQAQTEDFLALLGRAPGNGHKITDWEKFREFASDRGEKTQVEMAKLWDGQISSRTISRALKKIGFISNPVASELFISLFSPSAPSAPSAVKSFRCNRKRYYSKKKTSGYRERDEAKRQAFIAELSTILRDKIVDIYHHTPQISTCIEHIKFDRRESTKQSSRLTQNHPLH